MTACYVSEWKPSAALCDLISGILVAALGRASRRKMQFKYRLACLDGGDVWYGPSQSSSVTRQDRRPRPFVVLLFTLQKTISMLCNFYASWQVFCSSDLIIKFFLFLYRCNRTPPLCSVFLQLQCPVLFGNPTEEFHSKLFIFLVRCCQSHMKSCVGKSWRVLVFFAN